MPGFRDRQMFARCPECDGADVANVGFFLHRPTCSTQPGHEEAREREAADKGASPETKRLLELRTAKRLA